MPWPCLAPSWSVRGSQQGVVTNWRTIMGRGILLWLLGVPIPIIIILALLWH
jgi:hypothetical protein